MKKIFLNTSIALAAFLTFSSCSQDFLDVNHNPNEAYNNQLTPKERLAAAETTLYSTQAIIVNRFGNLMMNAWSGNVHYYASPFSDEFSMKADSNFYNEIWDNYYNGIANYQAIIDTKNASLDYPHHVAIAKIMKAYYMGYIVDLYNDAPYSEAFKGLSNPTPKYDKGADIYKNLVLELNDALVLLTKTPVAANVVAANQDPILAGVMTDWKKMALTVKLRLLVRQSKCTDNNVKTFVASELASMPTNTAEYVTSDVKINPGYSNASTAQQNPFYRAYGLVDINTGDYSANYRLVFGSEHIIDNLMGRTTSTSGLVDSRVSKMFLENGVANYLVVPDPTTAGYYGVKQGAQKDPSRVEADYATLGSTMYYRGGSTGSAQNGYVLTAAESKLLQSEAGISFPTSGFASNAQARFNEGVAASFTFYGLSSASAAYLASADSKPNVGWTASADKLAAIQYQRWIALTSINPLETYIDYTKTGYPVTPMPLGSYKPTRPLRLMYPQSEYIANSANVPTMSLDDVFTLNQYSPFWLK